MAERGITCNESVISNVKAKDDNLSSFDRAVLYKFELSLFLCLDITRFELQVMEKISDDTARGLQKLATFNTFEYFYRDYPEIYKKSSVLFRELAKYNENWKNDNLKHRVATPTAFWVNFFKRRITDLLKFNLSNNLNENKA